MCYHSEFGSSALRDVGHRLFSRVILHKLYIIKINLCIDHQMSNCVFCIFKNHFTGEGSVDQFISWSVDSRENRCHQMSDFKAKMHQHRPRCGSLERSPDPLAVFKGPKGRGI